MKKIQAGSTVVTYRSTGAGQPLVLLHGTSVDGPGNFGAVEAAFAAGRRVIIPDYAGAGESTVPDGELSLDTLIEQVAEVLRDQGTEPADLLGDSLGSVVAAGTAARYPELVRRLILVCGWATSADPRHQLVLETWSRMDAIGPEMGNRYIVPFALSPDALAGLAEEDLRAFVAQPPASGTGRRIRLGLRIDLEPELAKIVAPTLLIGGRQDYVVPPYQTRRLANAIPHSTFVQIDTGHAAFFERPQEIVALVSDFLD